LMALEDTAKLLAHKAPDQVLRILRCFQGGASRTFEELQQETGLNKKTLEYYLTILRRWYLLHSQKVMGEIRYFLSPEAFHARVDSLIVDPVRHLVEKQSSEPPT